MHLSVLTWTGINTSQVGCKAHERWTGRSNLIPDAPTKLPKWSFCMRFLFCGHRPSDITNTVPLPGGNLSNSTHRCEGITAPCHPTSLLPPKAGHPSHSSGGSNDKRSKIPHSPEGEHQSRSSKELGPGLNVQSSNPVYKVYLCSCVCVFL
jgi:hypothetical protein